MTTDAIVAVFRERLQRGLPAGEEVGDLCEALGLEQTEEIEVARRLVALVGGAEVERIAIAKDRRSDPRPAVGPVPVEGADTSFLGRLRTGDGSGGGLEVSTLEDPRTVMAVARAGALKQRRAAVRRLGELISDDRKSMTGELRRRVSDLLSGHRDVEIAYELSEARSHLSGARGREVRVERDQFDRLATQVSRAIKAFWDGDTTVEPVTALPGDQRAALLVRCRDLPDAVVDHIGAVIESPHIVDRDERLSLLSSLRFCGHPRLVASFKAVLDGRDPEIAVEASRALGRVDDPRVHPALLAAYERTVVDRHRIVLAGALGHAGDARGAGYVRQSLESDDPESVRFAFEALDTVGGVEDADAITRLIKAGGPGAQTVAGVRALGRIADGRALAALAELREQTSVSAIWAEMEDAVSGIRARMELRGEEQDSVALVTRTSDEDVALAKSTPAWIRLRAWKDYLLGQLWHGIGGAKRAIARFDRAAASRPDWGAPLIAVAMIHARKGRFAQALSAFRRAVEVDRPRAERTPHVAGTLCKVFLRRAEEVEHDGRHDIARGLLEEALELDLRRAPSSLRFEMNRRYERLRRRDR